MFVALREQRGVGSALGLLCQRDAHDAVRDDDGALDRAARDGVADTLVLEGSLRKSGTRIRITAQLIDVANGYHL